MNIRDPRIIGFVHQSDLTTHMESPAGAALFLYHRETAAQVGLIPVTAGVPALKDLVLDEGAACTKFYDGPENTELRKYVAMGWAMRIWQARADLEQSVRDRLSVAVGILQGLRLSGDLPEGTATMVEMLTRNGIDPQDFDLSAEDLETKYCAGNNDPQEHPYFPRFDWRLAVSNDDTLLGYWAWVQHKLTEEED